MEKMDKNKEDKESKKNRKKRGLWTTAPIILSAIPLAMAMCVIVPFVVKLLKKINSDGKSNLGRKNTSDEDEIYGM